MIWSFKFPLDHGFKVRNIDPTFFFFIKIKYSDMLLVQIYIDDIMFCVTNISLCKEFEKCTQSEFEIEHNRRV